jgi:hypothetical protein
MDEQAKQTPLVERLDAVPEDVRIGVQDGEVWHAGTTWHPVGRLCRDAAAELRRQNKEITALRAAVMAVRFQCEADSKAGEWTTPISKVLELIDVMKGDKV